MGQGRGSSAIMTVVMLLFCMLMLHSEMACAATYTVGYEAGWTYDIVNWPNGKRFEAGDILEFNYGVGQHNVVVVNRAGYNGCSTPSGAREYTSGRDRIQLAPGPNYFLCSYPGHCQAGMKIAVYAN